MRRTVPGSATPALDRQVEDAFVRHKRGDIGYAADVYRKALASRPDHARALHYLGLAAQQTGNAAQAVTLLERSIEADPTDPRAYNHLGQIHVRLNDKRAAAAMFERAVEIDPDHVDSLNNLANVTLTRDLAQATALYRRVLVLSPTSAFATYNLAQALNEDRAFDEAIALFQRTIILDPRHSQARFSLGLLLEQQGRFAEAIAQYLAVYRSDPRHVASLANLLGMRDYVPDLETVRRAESILHAQGGKDEDRIKLHRGLGKHYERAGDYDKAFAHFRNAKTIFAQTRVAFALDAATRPMERAKAVFLPDTFAGATLPVSVSPRMIFIVGLPRSGTTLTEQILASHPGVFGAGELPDIPRIARMLGPDYPQCLATMDADERAELAQDYLTSVTRAAGSNVAVATDKMPLNSLHLGLIATLFPEARIVYCRRDPRDIAISCFTELFDLEQDYTTRFEDFGAYVLHHDALMAHWDAVLPMPVHALRYEDLIADPEPTIRALLDYCGLDWDPACLDFHTTDRTVQTPSRWQVRQPIYRTSVGRWRRYEDHMAPLTQILAASDYVYDAATAAACDPSDRATSVRHAASPVVPPAAQPAVLEQPVFIVAAPRSGSTLLFETLAQSRGLSTLGGEAHWLVESIPELRPGQARTTSNRLTADDVTAERRDHIVRQITDRLVDHAGQPLAADGATIFLEKTPKNALRIPFFDRIFPDARFIFLWRDPRENISSIMEAWRSGRFTTYRGLPGFPEPWSLLLPPGYEAMRGQPLEEIAAFQWDTTNRIVLDDLSTLAPDRWTSVAYADLVSDPAATIERLLGFLGIEPDAAVAAHLDRPLPHSRYTQTAPSAKKWRVNAAEIETTADRFTETWHRLQSLK